MLRDVDTPTSDVNASTCFVPPVRRGVFSLTSPPPAHYQGTMHEELYTVLRVADLSKPLWWSLSSEAAPLSTE